MILSKPYARLLERHPHAMRQGSWALFGQAAVALATLLGTRILTEYVPAREWYFVSVSFLGLLLLVKNVVCAPVLQAQLRLYPEFKASDQIWLLRMACERILKRTTVFAIGILLLVAVIYRQWEALPLGGILMLTPLMVMEVFKYYEMTFFAANQQKAVSVVSAIEAWARPAVALLMVLVWSRNATAVLVGYGIGSALALTWMMKYLVREGFERRDAGPEMTQVERRLCSYALPIGASAVFSWTTSLGDRFIIGHLINQETAGIYALTYGLISQPFLQLQAITSRTLTPVIFRAASTNNSDLGRRASRTWLCIATLIGVSGFLIVCLFKNQISTLLLANGYRSEGSEFMVWIAGGYALQGIGAYFELRLLARMQTKRVLLTQCIVALSSLAIPMAMIPNYGALGVAMSCPIYFGVMIVSNFCIGLWNAPPRRNENAN